VRRAVQWWGCSAVSGGIGLLGGECGERCCSLGWFGDVTVGVTVSRGALDGLRWGW
jgi:hypothetical protein